MKTRISHVLLERHQRVIASGGFGCRCANRSELKASMQFLKQSKESCFLGITQMQKLGLVAVHVQPYFSLFYLYCPFNDEWTWMRNKVSNLYNLRVDHGTYQKNTSQAACSTLSSWL